MKEETIGAHHNILFRTSGYIERPHSHVAVQGGSSYTSKKTIGGGRGGGEGK